MQRVGVALRRGDQVVDELAAHPLLGLGDRALAQQQQGGDDGRPLEQPHLEVVEGPAGEHARVPSASVPASTGTAVTGAPPGATVARSAAPLPAAGAVAGSGPCSAVSASTAAVAARGVAHDDDRPARRRRARRGRRRAAPRSTAATSGRPPPVSITAVQPLVHGGGPLDLLAVALHEVVGLPQLVERGLHLGEQRGVLDGDGGVVGERGEQRGLVGAERPLPAVRGEQHADDRGPAAQRHAEDRDQALTADDVVDAVRQPRVGAVVGGGVRLARRGDQSAEPGAEAQLRPLEGVGADAVGDPHVGQLARLVVEHEVGGVGVEQLAGPAHDRLQHGLEVAQRRQVAGGLVERAELLLASAPGGEQRPDAQGVADGVAQRLPVRVERGQRRVGEHRVELLERGLGGEQRQQAVQGRGRVGRDGSARRRVEAHGCTPPATVADPLASSGHRTRPRDGPPWRLPTPAARSGWR